MVTWKDVVANAVTNEVQQAYSHAISQINELNYLVMDVYRIVNTAGEWPMLRDYDGGEPFPVLLESNREPRYVWMQNDGFWGANDLLWRNTAQSAQVMRCNNNQPEFGGGRKNVLDSATDPNFWEICEAINRAMDWVPRDLVNYLKQRGLPIPSDA